MFSKSTGAIGAREMMGNNGMMGGAMTWGMGIGHLLILVVILLALAALIKYLFFR